MLLGLRKCVIHIALGPDREGPGAFETVERRHGRFFHPTGQAGGAERASRKPIRKAMRRPAMMCAAPRNAPAYMGFSAGMLLIGTPARHAFRTFLRPARPLGATCRRGP